MSSGFANHTGTSSAFFWGRTQTSTCTYFSPGCVEIDRMVGFRDWLRAHGDDRTLYERTKRELATRTWRYVQNHADAKTAVVEEILARSMLHRLRKPRDFPRIEWRTELVRFILSLPLSRSALRP